MGDRIASVGPSVEAPRDALLVDGDGLTLLPGLIDAHAHVMEASQLAEALIFGVTTVLDMGTDAAAARRLKASENDSKTPPRADLRTAGTLVTVAGGHGTEYGIPIPTLSKAEDASSFVTKLVQEGSDYIKLIYDDGRAYDAHIPTLSPSMLSACIGASHQQKRMALVHVSTRDDAREAIADGADGLEHVFADAPGGDEFAKLVAEHQVFVTPTLTVLASLTNLSGRPDPAADAMLTPYLSRAALQSLRRGFPFQAKRLDYARAEDTVRAFHAAHVALLAGTDAPNPGTTFGASLHVELELLVRAGLTPVEALAAATSIPAQRFGLADRGRIAQGARADLLLVRGDPTTDVRATRDIVSVWKRGIIVDREAARASALAEKTTAPRPPDAPMAGADDLVSNFEEDQPSSTFGSGWVATTDGLLGGKSRAEIRVVPITGSPNRGSHKALHIEGQVKDGFVLPWAGAILYPGQRPMEPADLSTKQGIMFWARGEGKTYRLMLFSSKNGNAPSTRTFMASKEWKEVSFHFADFEHVDAREISGIAIVAGPDRGSFALDIDDVRLLAADANRR